jgi:hypothetical protein
MTTGIYRMLRRESLTVAFPFIVHLDAAGVD